MDGRCGDLYIGLPFPSSFRAVQQVSFVRWLWGLCEPHEVCFPEATVRLTADSQRSRLQVWSAGRWSGVPRLGILGDEATLLASLTKPLASWYLVAVVVDDGDSWEIGILSSITTARNQCNDNQLPPERAGKEDL